MTPRFLDRVETSAWTLLIIAAMVLAIAWGLGCASTNERHRMAVSSQVVASALFAVQDAEDAAFRAQRITPAQHHDFNVVMVQALKLGQEYNRVVRTWQPGQPVPPQIAALKEALFKLSTELIANWPADAKVQLQATLTAAYDAVLSVLLAAQVT